MKKIFSILFALVLVLSLSLVTAVPAAAAIINVNSGMTTPAINTAIAGAGSGDVVQFATGTYNLTAPLVVGVAGVILQGDTTTPSNVVINAPTSGSDKDAFQVKANNVTTQGFNIKNAISATSGNGWQNAGIMLGGDSTLVSWLTWPNVVNIDGGTFQNNIIDGCSLGIYLYESKNISVLNNTIQNSTTLNHPTAGAGIMCWNEGHQDPVNNTISGNIIRDNARIGICFGRWAARASCSGTIIQNNTITGNGDSSASGDEAGITLMWMDGDITITGNTISGNTYGILVGCDGFSSSYCTGVVAHCNNIENNNKSGTKLGIENRFNPAGDADQIDAENNWWGDVSGPSGSGTGTGDAVSVNVDYDPWSFTPDPCEPKSKGFWKNHPDSLDAVLLDGGSVLLGDFYLVENSEDAEPVFDNERAKCAEDMLAPQLLAAKLNVLHLTHLGLYTDCEEVDEAIDDADLELAGYDAATRCSIGKRGKYKQDMLALSDVLDSFNNGEMCGCACEWD